MSPHAEVPQVLRTSWSAVSAVIMQYPSHAEPRRARRGWLTAKKYEGRTTSVVVGYLYHEIGNRKQSLEGGEANGAESQTTCTANVLNQ